jgi:N-acetylglucosamine repressor
MANAFRKATHEQTRVHNRCLVLKIIYDQERISRAAIARMTQLTRATVSTAVGDLIEDGLVREVGLTSSTGGKPATLLSFVDDARHVISLDLANREFRGAVINLRGQILYRKNVPILPTDRDGTLGLLSILIDDLLREATRPVLGIGIGVPGIVDIEQGVIRHTIHLDWQNLALRAILAARYGLPIHMANDSHAAAIGEYMFGPYEDGASLLVLRIGPGISAGIVLNGSLHYGDGFAAGEIGHVSIQHNGQVCRCGHIGCLETLVSRKVLLESARAIAASDPDSKLHQFAASPDAICSTDIVLAAFSAGDQAICNLIAGMGRHLGMAVATLVGVLDVQHILVAGSMARFGEALLNPMRLEMERCVHYELAKHVRISPSYLGQDIVIQGAVALVLSKELGLA